MYHLAPRDRYSKGARTIVAIVFLGFLIFDGLLLLFTPPEFRGRLALQIGLSTMWNAVFLGAIWQRQNWARYVLCFFLLLSVVFGAGVTIPEYVAAKVPIPPILIVALVFHLTVLLVIAFNPTIRKFVHSR
jgi:hypothetical protein